MSAKADDQPCTLGQRSFARLQRFGSRETCHAASDSKRWCRCSFLANETAHGALDADVRERLLNASAAALDRLLKKTRAKHTRHGRATTKPGTLLRRTVPIATDQWRETRPGFIEADTVAHCGTTTAGQFAYSLTCVDLATGWMEQRAVWSKNDREVVVQMKDIERALPFDLLGFDSDNGGEFINYALLKHFIDRKQPVHVTRSRAYCSDDNAHVEQKNWTHVRQWLGYDRLGNSSVIDGCRSR